MRTWPPPEWPPQPDDVWHDDDLNVTWHTRADVDGRAEFYEPDGPGLVPADDVPKFVGGMRLTSRPNREITIYTGEVPF